MSYDEKYRAGGWDYNEDRERERLKKTIVEPFGFRPGDRVLEVGCGMGLHSALLAEMGFDVVGVDLSAVGIEAARARNSKARFVCSPAFSAPSFIESESQDFIFARGLSCYHYDLTDAETIRGTGALFDLLKPGAVFILQIKTDFSGRTEGGVLLNRLGAYYGLFERFGNVVSAANLAGVPLTSQEQAEAVGGDLIIGTQK